MLSWGCSVSPKVNVCELGLHGLSGGYRGGGQIFNRVKVKSLRG